jgi:hypothetical protein
MIVKRIQQSYFTLFAVVCVFFISGCQDFEDSRTPYQSFVQVEFHPLNKKDGIDITKIINIKTNEELTLFANKFARFPLDPNADVVQFYIFRTSSDVNTELEIHYRREGVLISHQCGGAQKYVLEKIPPTFVGKYQILNKELSTLNESVIDVQIYL